GGEPRRRSVPRPGPPRAHRPAPARARVLGRRHGRGPVGKARPPLGGGPDPPGAGRRRHRLQLPRPAAAGPPGRAHDQLRRRRGAAHRKARPGGGGGGVPRSAASGAAAVPPPPDWRHREAEGLAILRPLAGLLGLAYARDDGQFTWPTAVEWPFADVGDPAEREALAGGGGG